MPLSRYGTKSRQPAVIPVFFLTEMWERFGFYMMQSLLVLYMTSAIFGFSDSKSYSILAAFAALSYIMPLIGGYFASSILDFEHAIILGGLLLAAGYGLLAAHDQALFYIALSVIAVGNGFFKPNISSYLGSFYQPHDPHREKGYTLFYVGINIGTLLSTSTAGYIVRHYGWHMPYLIASIGLCVGTFIFILGLYFLRRIGKFHRVVPSSAEKDFLSITLTYFNVIAFILIAYEIIAHRRLANNLMLIIGTVIFFGLIAHAFQYQKKQIRKKILACVFLILISIVFWALYFQLFFSMSLFIERAVNRDFFHIKLPTPVFISIQSVFIILLGPLAAILWHKLARKNKNPSIPTKFTIALFMLVITFGLAYFGTTHPMQNGMTNKYYIVFAYFFLTVGELLLSPIGLTMVTLLSPTRLVGLMMGAWFVALGLGIKLGGIIADYAAIPKDIKTVSQMTVIYSHAFFTYAILSLICAILCLMAAPFISKLIKTEK